MTESRCNSSDSNSNAPDVVQSKCNKRKATYLVRKEEAQALNKKVQALRSQLAALQGVSDEDKYRLKMTETENQLLKDLVHNQQLAVVSASSMIFERLQNPRDNPIYTYIHLPKLWNARREALVAMKDDKLRQTYRYLKERSRYLDLLKQRSSEDRCEDSDGNFTCHCFDVTQFHAVQPLKQVFDALVLYVFNLEISISEKTGVIMIREDYDNLNDGARILNHRFISNHESGETTEANAVAFAQYFEGRNEFENQSCAIFATDSVDEDDIHPFDSQHRIRRDITVGIVLTLEQCSKRSKRPQSDSNEGSLSALGRILNDDNSDNEEELVVVMRRVAFMKVYRPDFDVPDDVLLELHDGIAKWPTLMLQGFREIIRGNNSLSS